MQLGSQQVQGTTRSILVAGVVANQAAALIKFMHDKGAFGSSRSLRTAAYAARDAVSGLIGLAPAEITSAARGMATELQAAGIQGITMGHSADSTALVPLVPGSLPASARRTIDLESALGRFLEILTRGHGQLMSRLIPTRAPDGRAPPLLALPAGQADTVAAMSAPWGVLVVMLLMAMALVAVIAVLVRAGTIAPIKFGHSKGSPKFHNTKLQANINAALGKRISAKMNAASNGGDLVHTLVARALESAANNVVSTSKTNKNQNDKIANGALLQYIAEAVNGPISDAGTLSRRGSGSSSWSSGAASSQGSVSSSSSASSEVLLESLYDAAQHASALPTGPSLGSCSKDGAATYEIVIRRIAAIEAESLDRLVRAFTHKVNQSLSGKKEDSKTAPARRLAGLLSATARTMRCEARHMRDTGAVDDKIRESLVPAALSIARSLQAASAGSEKFVTLAFVNAIDDPRLKAAVMAELQNSINSLGARVRNDDGAANTGCDPRRVRRVAKLLNAAFATEAAPKSAAVSQAVLSALSHLKRCGIHQGDGSSSSVMEPVHEAVLGAIRRMTEPEKRRLFAELNRVPAAAPLLTRLAQQYEEQHLSKVNPADYGSLSNVDLFRAMSSSEAQSIPTSEYVAYLAALSSTKMLHRGVDLARAAALRADPRLIASRVAAFYAVPKVPVARKRVASALRHICNKMPAARRAQLAAALREVRPALAVICGQNEKI